MRRRVRSCAWLLGVALLTLSCKEAPVRVESERATAASEDSAAPSPSAAGTLLPGEEAWRPLLSEGRWDDARAFCQDLVLADSDRVAASGHACFANMAIMGCVGDRGGCTDEAVDSLARALDRAPEARRLHLGRLRVLVDGGRTDRLDEALSDTFARRPGSEEDVPTYMGYAVELIQGGRLEDAAAYTEVLRTRFPRHPEVLATLGACLLDLGEMQRAERWLLQALELSPDDPNVNWSFAWLLANTDRFDRSRPFFENAVATSRSPAAVKAWGCVYGNLLEENGDRPEACRWQRNHCGPGSWTACAP